MSTSYGIHLYIRVIQRTYFVPITQPIYGLMYQSLSNDFPGVSAMAAITDTKGILRSLGPSAGRRALETEAYWVVR